MNSAQQSFLHVSQNIPRQSPMVVKMRQPRQSQVHVSQAVPSSSPLTWKLEGDPGINQVGQHCLTLSDITSCNLTINNTWFSKEYSIEYVLLSTLYSVESHLKCSFFIHFENSDPANN